MLFIMAFILLIAAGAFATQSTIRRVIVAGFCRMRIRVAKGAERHGLPRVVGEYSGKGGDDEGRVRMYAGGDYDHLAL